MQVSRRAKQLFSELSKKGHAGHNPIFALMPDILSNLSADESLPPESFKTIMQFLLAFVSKDKQIDALVSRLVARLTPDLDIGGARVFVFCVQQLKPGVKGVRSLEERLGQWRHFLVDAEFASSIQVRRVLAQAVSATKCDMLSMAPLSCNIKQIVDSAAQMRWRSHMTPQISDIISKHNAIVLHCAPPTSLGAGHPKESCRCLQRQAGRGRVCGKCPESHCRGKGRAL